MFFLFLENVPYRVTEVYTSVDTTGNLKQENLYASLTTYAYDYDDQWTPV